MQVTNKTLSLTQRWAWYHNQQIIMGTKVMSSPSTTNPSNPARDGRFQNVAVNTNTTRGRPPQDAVFSNLRTGGIVTPGQNDLCLSALAVTNIVSGKGVAGNNVKHIGHV